MEKCAGSDYERALSDLKAPLSDTKIPPSGPKASHQTQQLAPYESTFGSDRAHFHSNGAFQGLKIWSKFRPDIKSFKVCFFTIPDRTCKRNTRQEYRKLWFDTLKLRRLVFIVEALAVIFQLGPISIAKESANISHLIKLSFVFF